MNRVSGKSLTEEGKRWELTEEDLHPHIRSRMDQRGVTFREIDETLNNGWQAEDAKPGTEGKTFIFPFGANWEGRTFEEKEVTVYYKKRGNRLMLLTCKARYGTKFVRGDADEG